MHWGECNWRILLVGDTLYCFKLILHWECDVNVLEMHCYTRRECNRRILLVGDTLYCFKLIFHWECDVNVLEMHCYTRGECNRHILLVGDKSRWQGGAAGLHYTLLATPHFNCSCIIYNVYFNRTLLYFIEIQCHTSLQLLFQSHYIVLYCNTMSHLNSTTLLHYLVLYCTEL